jgi:hypothetical protein
MGNQFKLVNFTKKEYISFEQIDGSKEAEIIGNKRSAQLVAYYLFEWTGDEIMYIGDQWQVHSARHDFEERYNEFKDVTLEIVKAFNEFMYDWQMPENQIPLAATLDSPVIGKVSTEQ